MSAIGTETIETFSPPGVTAHDRLHLASAVALLAVLAGIPLVANDYWLNAVLIPFLIMSLAALGLNLLMGYAGQASLGSGGFMSVGAYATYNLLLRLPELPLPVSLLLGGIVAGLVGVIAGLPSLRIKGFYLVASTLAAQFLLEWLFNQYGWFSNYSTSSSISAPRLALLGHDLSSPAGRYLLTLATVAAVTVISIRLVRSQTGLTWMAIRDMDTAASVIGIPVSAGKLKAFFVSSLVIGIAGALWGFAYLGTVDARSFNLDRSFEVMFAIIIGGMGSISGGYLGAAFMILLPILLDHVGGRLFAGAVDAGQLENFQKALFGALIVWFLIKEPRGLAALLSRVWTQLVSRLAR
ncbi:branched-chain amino acid ABC transporter permease [Bradyrhizobium sp. CCBAU 53421]|uniref:branched-chain amino acid ABC transporter permease n=1 Tax=Bradyrhizobium sp. CCBAU 53421 TaxID=1325120 RepID=UPI00188B18F5|nr:branched-chain amino acid ABC transporter permease [Bradyrhizobium sp. CCBAU 53421]QOZ32892.1 branched-chain amino acid ABC transporter permease [Bradyrhizobium sp. CCBAU 53421]